MNDAIWTPEQVKCLFDYQSNGNFHPFTCPNRDEGHPEIAGDTGMLVPTRRGWICPFCDYTQDWAHAFMMRPLPNGPNEKIQAMYNTYLVNKAASTQRPDEEEPQGSDTADAASSDISLTHIKTLETTIELLLEEAERRKEEISCLHRQISDLQDQLAKSCCRSAGF